VSSSQSNKENDIALGSTDLVVEVEDGRFTKYGKEGLLYLFEYDSAGRLTKSTQHPERSGGVDVVINYDELGWPDYSGNPDEYSDITRDSAGNLTGFTYKGLDGKKHQKSLTIDEHGNVVETSLDSVKEYEIEYVQVDNPSTAMRAFAGVKYMGGHPLFDRVSSTIR